MSVFVFEKKKSFSKVKSDCEMQRRKEFYFELILAWKMPWPILVNYPLSNYGFSLNERKFRVNFYFPSLLSTSGPQSNLSEVSVCY